jgi:hypothetical protein
MRKSLYIPIASLFIALLCMATQCNKEYIEYKYNFIEKVDLFPAQKSYQVGDTIWLQYVNPSKRLFDNRTSQNIAVDTVSVQFQVSFNRRYNTPVNPSDGFCDYVTTNGINAGRYLADNGTGFFFTFGCSSNNSYDFKIGVVPNQKGIYSLDLSGNPGYLNPCSNRISGFPPSTIEYRFNVVDGNKDIYLAIPPNSRGESPKGSTESKIDGKQVFVVKVE